MGLTACEGPAGEPGEAGPAGDPGADGAPGADGDDGADGAPGADGEDGADGQNGQNGVSLDERPLSSTVALVLTGPERAAYASIQDYVKDLVDQYDANNGPVDGIQFPLIDAWTDSVRAIQGIQYNVVISWLDPISDDGSLVWGANNDYIAYVGDGFTPFAGGPQGTGNSSAGWLWSNFEYISNSAPDVGAAPNGQNLTLALWMQQNGEFAFDVTVDANWDQAAVDLFIERAREMHGGAWVRVIQDPSTLEWTVDLRAGNVRYDGTSNTLSKVEGLDFTGRTDMIADDGTVLPEGVVPGITGDCSGGLSPWGSIITAEENVQGYFGDLEPGYDSQFLDPAGTHGFVPGAAITLDVTPSTTGAWGRHSDPNFQKPRDAYGYLVEIDAGLPADAYYGSDVANPENGHMKLGSFGRARWENATYVTDTNWDFTPGQPIVMYGGNDRRSGRVYKWVSNGNVDATPTKAEIRTLMESGTLYVAHFANLDNDTGFTVDGDFPYEGALNEGVGQWIEVSTSSTDTPPNYGAAGLVNPNDATTVGAALQDNDYNNIGGFADDETVLRALYTAANKLGIKELNRPEDVEWNPFTQRLYIAFTGHSDDVGLDDNGVLLTAKSDRRAGHSGTMMVLEEGNAANPAASSTFTFYSVGSATSAGNSNGVAGDANGEFSWAAIDNIMIDPDGGVWFGTDGNPRQNSGTDALYYLDTDPTHVNTYGLAFRVAAGPSDSEATGPYIVPDGRTIFFNVQHPGESDFSAWP